MPASASTWIAPAPIARRLLDRLLEEQAGLVREVNRLRASLLMTYQDPLTGLGSRRYLESRLAEELSRVERNPSSAGSLLLMDFDGLTTVNARHGNAVGDRALRFIAKVLKESLRASDVACHLDRGQFAAILCDTDVAGAVEVTARIDRHLARARGGRWSTETVTTSVAAWPPDAGTVVGLMASARAGIRTARRRRHTRDRSRLALVP